MSDLVKAVLGTVIGVLVISGITLVFSSFVIIEPGEKGLVVSMGKFNRVIDSGFHLKNPFIDNVVVLSTRIDKFDVEATAASRDLQTVTTTVVVNYSLNENTLRQLYEEIGVNYGARIMQPAIQESVKAATALFTAEELVSKRTEVRDAMLTTLRERLSRSYITVSDVSIIDFSFSSAFDESIEAKQVAEQKALQAQNDLKRVQLEAQQQIEQAKAQSESTRLQAEALKHSTQVVELRKAEALQEFARKWDGQMPTTVIMGDGVMPLMNLTN